MIAERTLGVTIADARARPDFGRRRNARLGSAVACRPHFRLRCRNDDRPSGLITMAPRLLSSRRRCGVGCGGSPDILGEQEFWSLPFRVTRDTLIPRPDTETLVEAALAWRARRVADGPQILDLGTGSGCLLLALLVELPAARGIGIDISQPALAAAKTPRVSGSGQGGVRLRRLGEPALGQIRSRGLQPTIHC